MQSIKFSNCDTIHFKIWTNTFHFHCFLQSNFSQTPISNLTCPFQNPHKSNSIRICDNIFLSSFSHYPLFAPLHYKLAKNFCFEKFCCFYYFCISFLNSYCFLQKRSNYIKQTTKLFIAILYKIVLIFDNFIKQKLFFNEHTLPLSNINSYLDLHYQKFHKFSNTLVSKNAKLS